MIGPAYVPGLAWVRELGDEGKKYKWRNITLV
jgi:hypothetical protein